MWMNTTMTIYSESLDSGLVSGSKRSLIRAKKSVFLTFLKPMFAFSSISITTSPSLMSERKLHACQIRNMLLTG